jgi:hypothetical protein
MRAWLAVLLAVATPAAAQAPVAVALSGHIAHPRTLDAADLSPAVTVEVPASGKPDAPKTQFGGVLLWPLLDGAGWVDAPGRKTHLQHVILARGRDGYAVALAIAEIDPGFEGKQVLIATTQDGKKLAAPELVVPGDRRAGRRVHDLTGIEVQ